MSLFISVIRRRASLSYLRDPTAPKAWDNNDRANSLDSFMVYEDDLRGPQLFSCRAQTVSNTEGLIDGMLYGHTIAAGPFSIKAFVEPRAFYGRIHGLCACYTMDGSWINEDSVIKGNPNRWLIHDWQKHKPEAPGKDTRVAWSAGCFVLPDADLVKLGKLFDTFGVAPGDIIHGQLVEEA